jgi:septum formation protein
VAPQEVEELDTGDPTEVAVENARRKALAASAGAPPGALIIGVDTLVATEDRIWGKPIDEEDARATLGALSGISHAVHSGLALARDGEIRVVHDLTTVTFRELSPATIDWYLACGVWRGRAGGYAIQGRGGALVRRIEGDYLNVVGLPVCVLLDLEPALISPISS